VVKLKACPYVHAGRRQGCSVVKLKACPQWEGSGEGKSVMAMAQYPRKRGPSGPSPLRLINIRTSIRCIMDAKWCRRETLGAI